MTLTGSTVSVAAITALGTAATTSGFDGGAGGAVLLDATAGNITLGGDITTTGGNGSGAGLGGNAGSISLNDAVSLTGNRTLSAVGGTETPRVPEEIFNFWGRSTAAVPPHVPSRSPPGRRRHHRGSRRHYFCSTSALTGR